MLARRCLSLIPRSARGRLGAVIPFHRQISLVRLLTRPRLVLTLALRRLLRPVRGRPGQPARCWVPLDGRVLLAVVDDDATPLSTHRQNLDLVVDELERAGVEHFVIPDSIRLRSRIGVPADQRLAALDAVSGIADTLVWTAGRRARRLTGRRLGRRRPRRPRASRRVPRPLRDAPVIGVFRPVTCVSGALVYGRATACEIEFWPPAGDRLQAPRRNAFTTAVPATSAPVRIAGDLVNGFAPAAGPARYPTRPEFRGRPVDWADFPVDAVYTWVDGEDPHWRSRYLAARSRQGALSDQAANEARYASHDELRYSLRSLHLYAPWIRRVFLVTADQVPAWLDVDHPRLTVINHRDLLGPHTVLPTFNSHAIESALHEIDGLAEHFVYVNDDVFLGRPVTRNTFFHGNGLAAFYLSNVARIEYGEPSVDDPPVTAAGKNNRRIIRERFDRLVTQKMKHTPHPLRRSVLAEICAAVPDDVARTRANQFRHPSDLSIASSLHHYWSYLNGLSVPGRIRYLYTDLADPQTPLRMHHLLHRRDYDTFCVNDTITGHRQRGLMETFLDRYFPTRSPYEVEPDMEAERSRFSPTELSQRLFRPPVGRYPAGPLVRLDPASPPLDRLPRLDQLQPH